MSVKKWLPFVLLLVLAVVAIGLRQCKQSTTGKKEKSIVVNPVTPINNDKDAKRFNRNVAELFFTKHARCRMKCRHITQQEVREILVNGLINYNKSDLNAPEGPKYALEGITTDKQEVRIIFAPKQKHMTVVTVIDLGTTWRCPSCE